MRIGIDATCWANRRGFGRFTRELLRALLAHDTRNEYVFFADEATAAASTFPDGAVVRTARTSVSPTEAASASGRRSLTDVGALTRAVWKERLDAFFFPAVYSYFPVLNRTPIVLTVHDVIADHHPEATFPSKKLMYFWKAKQNLALWQADRVLTVSEYSKRTICAYFGLAPEEVDVTVEGPSEVFAPLPAGSADADVLARYDLAPNDRFFLYVGGISPHKNLGRLAEAMAQLHRDEAHTDVRLVLVGDYQGDAFHSDYPRLTRHIEAHGLHDAVQFTGYVPDDDLVHLYHAAQALVFPSLEEGFGLPAVEAMACGTPVLASDRGSLPEILGGAGRLFDPLDPEAIHAQLRAVLADPALRERLSAKGLERARTYTWAAAAEGLVDLFERLARP